MAISRYKKENVINNNDADYKKIFNTRFGTLGLYQTSTTTFRKPTESEISQMEYINIYWELGKRLYKLAHEY